MRWFALILLTWGANEVSATDLTQVDRTITKEPVYKQKPKYLLAVFGKDAETKVWLIFEGETLYVDTDGSGDLTAPGKRFSKPTRVDPAAEGGETLVYDGILIVDKDGKTRHSLQVQVTQPTGALYLRVQEPRIQYTGGIEDGTLTAADHAKDAPILHFRGPLVVMPGLRYWPNSAIEKLSQFEQNKPISLQAKIGTPGLGKGTFVCLNPALGGSFASGTGEKLGDQGPEVEIEYSSSDPQAPAIKAKYQLSLYCCCGICSAEVQPPAQVGMGKVKLTFTFPGSSEGLVAAKTYEVKLAGKGE